jgi:hypothetical protein
MEKERKNLKFERYLNKAIVLCYACGKKIEGRYGWSRTRKGASRQGPLVLSTKYMKLWSFVQHLTKAA